MLLSLPIVTFCIDKFSFNKNIKKKWLEVAIIFALICVGANIAKLILGYQYGQVGVIFSVACYIVAVILHNNIKHEIENDNLKEIQQEMQDRINPDRMYERLGVDIICLQVGRGLLQIVDPNINPILFANLAAMRQRLTDTYGYIIPRIRIMDSISLGNYEYSISIRHKAITNGIVDLEQIVDDKKAVDIIISDLEECFITHVDKILMESDVEKYIAIAKDANPTQVDYLLGKFSIYDIRKILVNLIKEKFSIRDICFIFMKLNEFSKETTNIEVLSKKLQIALSAFKDS